MISAQSSHYTPSSQLQEPLISLRGRDPNTRTSGDPVPRCRSQSRRISERRPVKAVARSEYRPGALHVGDAVYVFSQSADDWVDAQVVKLAEDNYVRVKCEVGKSWHCKTLHLHSERLKIPSSQHVGANAPAKPFQGCRSVLPAECGGDPKKYYMEMDYIFTLLEQERVVSHKRFFKKSFS